MKDADEIKGLIQQVLDKVTALGEGSGGIDARMRKLEEDLARIIQGQQDIFSVLNSRREDRTWTTRHIRYAGHFLKDAAGDALKDAGDEEDEP